MKQCQHCHAEIPDQSQFCPECGQRQSTDSSQKTEALCPVCHEPIVPGSRFCGSCGHPFPSDSESEKTATAAVSETNDAAVPDQTPLPADEATSTVAEPVDAQEDQDHENDREFGNEAPEMAAPDDAEKPEKIGAVPTEIAAAEVQSAELDTEPDATDLTVPPDTAKPILPDETPPTADDAADDTETQPDDLKPTAKQPPAAAASTSGPLFCPGCGHKLSPGAQFCPSCGRKTHRDPSGQPLAAPVAAPVPAAPHPPAAGGWVPPTSTQPPIQQQPFAPPQSGGWTPPPYAAGNPPPRKKKKGLWVALIIILVLVLAAGGAYALFGREIRRMILGNKATYLKIEALEMKADASEMARQLTELGNRAEAPPVGGHDFSLSLDWPDNMEGMDPVMQATLESLDIQGRLLYDREGSTPRYFAGIDLLTGAEPLLTLEGYYDQNQLVLGLPGIISRYIQIPREMMDEYGSQIGVDPAETGDVLGLADSLLGFDFGVSEMELAGSLHTYIDIILEHIDSVTYDKDQTLTVGPVSQDYDRFTMSIGDENARKMIEEILLTLRDDEVMFRMVSEIGQMSAGLDPAMLEYDDLGEVIVPELTEAEWQQTIDELLAEIEAEDPDREPFTIVQSIYVDSSDQVFGRDFQIINSLEQTVLRIEQYQPEEDNEGAVLLRIDSEGDLISYENHYTWDDDHETRSGTLTLSDRETALMEVRYTDYEKADIGSRTYWLGDFDLTFYDDEPVVLGLRASRDGDRVTMALDIQDMMGLQIGYQELSQADVIFPTYSEDQLVSINDYEALAGLMDENAMNELMRIARQLGLMPQGDSE